MQVEGGDLAAVFADDSIADGKTETGSLARLARGVEGVEGASRLAEAGAGVRDDQVQVWPSWLTVMRMVGERSPSSAPRGRLVPRISGVPALGPSPLRRRSLPAAMA